MNYKEFQILNNFRLIARDEVVLDCDNKQGLGNLGIRRIGMVMSVEGYRIELYKAEGQKSYHAHIKNISHISELTKEQNKLYKELLIKKYVEKVREFVEAPELDDIDFSVCVADHLIAEENKLHFKYKTIKKQIAIVNEGYTNFCEKDIYNKVVSENKESKIIIEGSGIIAKITQKISIIELAKKFGLEVNSGGFAVCPFHDDNNPSLKFYDEQGRFFCFGCRTGGNIVKFYAMLKKINLKFIL